MELALLEVGYDWGEITGPRTWVPFDDRAARGFDHRLIVDGAAFHLTETSAGQALVGSDDGKGSIKLWTLRWHQMRRIGYL